MTHKRAKFLFDAEVKIKKKGRGYNRAHHHSTIKCWTRQWFKRTTPYDFDHFFSQHTKRCPPTLT